MISTLVLSYIYFIGDPRSSSNQCTLLLCCSSPVPTNVTEVQFLLLNTEDKKPLYGGALALEALHQWEGHEEYYQLLGPVSHPSTTAPHGTMPVKTVS